MNPPRLEGLDTNKKLAVLFCVGLAASGCYQAVAGSVHTDQTPLGAGGLVPSAGGLSGGSQGTGIAGTGGSSGGSGGLGQREEIPTPDAGGSPGDDPLCLITTEGLPSCEDARAEPATIAEASEFGPEAKFVQLEGSAVLVDRGASSADGRFAVLTVEGFSQAPAVFEFDKTAASRPIDVRGIWPSYSDLILPDVALVALVCTADDGCQVWGRTSDELTIHPLALTEPPLNGEINTLFPTYWRFCALGEQLACLTADGLWDLAPSLPPEAGARITEVFPAVSPDLPFQALTETGIIVERLEFGAWSIAAKQGSDEVVALQHRLHFDEAGNWMPDVESHPGLVCSNPGMTQVQAFGGEQFVVFFANGSTYFRAYQRATGTFHWCESQTEVPVLATSLVQCGVYSMFFVLTADRWVSQFGPLGCDLD